MESITRFLSEVLTVYIVTCVITSSSIFEPIREWIKRNFPFLQIGDHPHFIECRLCLGFWVSMIVCIALVNPLWILPVFGLSYFMATLERS